MRSLKKNKEREREENKGLKKKVNDERERTEQVEG